VADQVHEPTSDFLVGGNIVIRIKYSSILAVIVAATTGIAHAADLKPETIDAWEEYVRANEAGIHARLNGGKAFLWMDEMQDRKERIRRGEITVAPVVGNGTQSVPNGLIHHWVGAVFISNAILRNLLAVIENYDGYKQIYKPAVVDSRALASNATDEEFSMVWLRQVLFVRAAMAAQYRARYFVVDARRSYSVIDSTQIQQIEGYGRPVERLLPPDTGSGFIWRIHSTRDTNRMTAECLWRLKQLPSAVTFRPQ
jgi:hypothetical protein